MDLASIIECPIDNKGNFYFPRIAPGTYLGENSYISGAVWIDLSAIRHSVSIRGDAVNPQSIYFSDYPTKFPYSITIGKGSAIDDGVSIHPTEDRNHPCIIGNFVLIGHNSVIHGKEIKDLSVAFIGSVTSEATVMGEESLLDAGATLPVGKILPDHGLYIVRSDGGEIHSAKTYQLDRAKSSHLTNTREASLAATSYSRRWKNDDGGTYRKKKQNLSKILYCLDALEEISSVLPEKIKSNFSSISNDIQIYFELKEGIPNQVNLKSLSQNLRNLFDEIKNLDIKNGIEIERSKHRFNSDGTTKAYKYDFIELSNIIHFVKQVAERGIGNLDKVNEFSQDSGIHGVWAYYGIDHNKTKYEVTNDSKIETSPKDCVEILDLQAPLVRYFIQPQTRLQTDIIKNINDNKQYSQISEFIDLMDILKKIALKQSLEDIDHAGNLIKNHEKIFKSLLQIPEIETLFTKAKNNCTELKENPDRFPPINGKNPKTFKDIVTSFIKDFKDNFPALWLGKEILPTKPKNLNDLYLEPSRKYASSFSKPHQIQ